MDAEAGVTANLLVTPAELAGERVVVEGEAYRHLFRARRLASDARLRLVDGEGRARWAEVAAIDRKCAELRLLGEAPAHDATRRVELLVAAPRPERAAWLVEKATELGVAAVRFLASERAVRGVDVKSLARLRRIAGAALEQCGGARLPALSGPHDFAELPQLGLPGVLYLLEPEAAEPLPVGGEVAAAVLVGPEGGWTEDELATLALIATPVRLGERVLRVETAAIAAAALLIAR
ncbi:MAG TPA: RsmE family RNA methyltransferase [Thermoanaerobaculia bacterium]|nr:RsmE family RNA methyltransferase [Thermoanaerobaculia bacterium]HXT49990.1 RsmE family RNA methyltransferase [Thermoanaerobaculia bacterium]